MNTRLNITTRDDAVQYLKKRLRWFKTKHNFRYPKWNDRDVEMLSVLIDEKGEEFNDNCRNFLS